MTWPIPFLSFSLATLLGFPSPAFAMCDTKQFAAMSDHRRAVLADAFVRFQPLLRNQIRRRLGYIGQAEDIADEIAQDAFVGLALHAQNFPHKFEGDLGILSAEEYLLRVTPVAYRVANYFRKRGNKPMSRTEIDWNAVKSDEADPNAATPAWRKRLDKRASDALSNWPQDKWPARLRWEMAQDGELQHLEDQLKSRARAELAEILAKPHPDKARAVYLSHLVERPVSKEWLDELWTEAIHYLEDYGAKFSTQVARRRANENAREISAVWTRARFYDEIEVLDRKAQFVLYQKYIQNQDQKTQFERLSALGPSFAPKNRHGIADIISRSRVTLNQAQSEGSAPFDADTLMIYDQRGAEKDNHILVRGYDVSQNEFLKQIQLKDQLSATDLGKLLPLLTPKQTFAMEYDLIFQHAYPGADLEAKVRELQSILNLGNKDASRKLLNAGIESIRQLSGKASLSKETLFKLGKELYDSGWAKLHPLIPPE